jgi:hypothetical protein
MTAHFRFGTFAIPALLAACLCPVWAQQPAQTQPGQAQPVQPPAGPGTGTPASSAVAQGQHPPPVEPAILEDGGLSIEPIYWLNRAQPRLFGGAAATAFGNLDYPGHANNSIGGELSFPAGRSNTLRLSYFRVQGNANTTLSQDATIFSEAYNAGDYLEAGYRLQNAKISWDYLSYSWHKSPGALRLKTLWELQYTTISTTVYAPFKPVTTDTSGNTDQNIATGSKNIFLPTFGLELEQAIGRHFRWEAKASGFGIPHHSNMWDGEGLIAIRFGGVELIGGEKAYHFKSSAQSSEYFVDTLSGPFVALRYYFGHQR